MDLAAFQLGKLSQSQLSRCALRSAHGECDQNLICVETGIFAAQIFDLQLLDRFNRSGGDHMLVVGDSGQLF